MRAHPLLRTLDIAVAVVVPALENDVRRQPVLVPLKREHPRQFLSRGRSHVPRNQIEHEIVPGRRGPRAHELFAPAGDDEHAIGMNGNGRIARRERRGVAEMHRYVLAIEESGLGQEKDS